MFHKRWSYWSETIDSGQPLDKPIPKIKFSSQPHTETSDNIKECINHMQRKGYSSQAWMSFVEWLLWGFGSGLQKEFPRNVSEDVSLYWYKKFNLGLMLKYPCDYMAWGSCEIQNMSKSHKGVGYVPTPGHIVDAMVKMMMTDADKTSTVCDPCLGTGIMLLYASNYSLRLYGSDISLDMVKMAHVNAWIYVPWAIFPADGLIDWTDSKARNNTLKLVSGCRKQKKRLLLTYNPRTGTLGDWM